MRPFIIFCLHFITFLLFEANAKSNFLQHSQDSNPSLKNSENLTLEIMKTNPLPMIKTPVSFELLSLNNSSFSQVSNKQALEGILGVPNAAIYNITLSSLSSSNTQEDATEIIKNLSENIVFVWENTIPQNTIKFLDILSEIQLNSQTSFNFTLTHKCYKELMSNELTCIFTIKPKLKSFSTFRRLTEETNTTGAESSNTTKPNTSTNTTKPGTETTPPTKPTENSGNENKPPKTEITTVQAKTSFQSIVLLLIVGLAIAALVVALLKYRKKWRMKKILASGGTRSNKKIDVQKLIIKPSFLNLNHPQGESGLGSMSSGKGKRTLFLSDTNYAMSPVIDVKTIHHLNLEENHRSSMIPEEVILTNIDDSQESKGSSKSSVDASPQDLGFNIEFSMLEVQESSKFQSKNLKSEE